MRDQRSTTSHEDSTWHWACSQRNESRSKSRFGTWFGPFPDITLCEHKALSYQVFETRYWNEKKKLAFWIVIHVESLILRTCECKALSERDSIRVHFGSACWNYAWVNQRGLRSRNKILPCSAQILFVIGMAFGMLVNTHSSNHDPNQEADRDPKRLSERDSSSIVNTAYCQILTSGPTSESRDWRTCAHGDVMHASQYQSWSCATESCVVCGGHYKWRVLEAICSSTSITVEPHYNEVGYNKILS